MKRKAVSGIILALLMLTISTLPFSIHPAKASGTIYVRADGSVEPPTAPIQRDGNVYTFTDNIHDGIVIERSDIIVDGAGYTLQGTGAFNSTGIAVVSEGGNVTIMNMHIDSFDVGIVVAIGPGGISSSDDNSIHKNRITNTDYGIVLFNSSRNAIYENNITRNMLGIWSMYADYSTISRNNITNTSFVGLYIWIDSDYSTISRNNIECNAARGAAGVVLAGSSNNNMSRNNVTGHIWGTYLARTSDNIVFENNIANHNSSGILLWESSSNRFYYNNLMNNTQHVYDMSWDNASASPSVNIWDDGYPSGGNYWDDYSDVDLYCGPSQDIPGSDGIWDHSYIIDEGNQDNYPLVEPYAPVSGIPDFEITVTPQSRVVKPGWTTEFMIYVTSKNGFSSEVLLSAEITPVLLDDTPIDRVRCEFVTPSVTPSPDGQPAESIMNVQTSRWLLLGRIPILPAEPNEYGITIQGTSRDIVHETTVKLIVADHILHVEIDWMEGCKPSDEARGYIQEYFMSTREHVYINFTLDEEIPIDGFTTLEEFYELEEIHNKLGGDNIAENGGPVYNTKDKWVLYVNSSMGDGYCDVPHEIETVTKFNGEIVDNYVYPDRSLSTSMGNYICIDNSSINNLPSAWEDQGYSGIREQDVEKMLLMHELGHSIGILRLQRDFSLANVDGDGILWGPDAWDGSVLDGIQWEFEMNEFVEDYDNDRTSVMSNTNHLACGYDNGTIHYSRQYWSLTDLDNYEVTR